MKKLIVLFGLFVLFSLPTFAQTRVLKLDFGTLANSVTETKYLGLGEWSQIDSISVGYAATGEIDVDSIDIYIGWNNSTFAGELPTTGSYGATAYTFISTLDNAASIKTWANILVAGATSLTGAVLRGGVNSLKVVTRGSTAGNDATDPNKFVVLFHIWGTK